MPRRFTALLNGEADHCLAGVESSQRSLYGTSTTPGIERKVQSRLSVGMSPVTLETFVAKWQEVGREQAYPCNLLSSSQR